VALNLSFEGRTFPSAEPYRVGREKIREFADAIGADDPAYRDPAAAAKLGHPDVIAPPTFPVLLTMGVSKPVLDNPELGLEYSRVVHGDQRFAYERPVRAGDVLTCVPTIESVSSRSGLDSVTIRFAVATEAGEPVVTVWTRLVARAAED
jgi:acyl dehydratase